MVEGDVLKYTNQQPLDRHIRVISTLVVLFVIHPALFSKADLPLSCFCITNN